MMMQDWIPAGVASALFGLFATWLTKRTERRSNEKLAALTAELREREIRLEAEFRGREAGIASLSTSAIGALSARQVTLHGRRVAAVDKLWAAVVALGAARNLSTMMTGIKFREAVRESKDNPSVRELAETILKISGFTSVRTELAEATMVRPFVTRTVWASYSAYSAICTMAVVRWYAIQNGLGSDALMRDDGVAALIKAALPGFGPFIDEHGPESFHYVLEHLETKLLQDIEAMLGGKEDDAAAIAQAARIQEAVKAVDDQRIAAVPPAAWTMGSQR
jgi:hypothetical protein